ncbi:MAG: hypothetical protein KC543_10010 [Myxococcales bacterium]|nr:hypothetical protein [Myxococcales bacterium]
MTPFYERELAGFLGRQTPEEIADIWSELRVIRELIAILRDPVSGDSTAARARELRRLQRAFERAGTYTRTQLAMHRDVRAPLLAAYRRPRLADALDAGLLACPRCGASMLSQRIECTVCCEHWRVCASCHAPTTDRDRCTVCDAQRR